MMTRVNTLKEDLILIIEISSLCIFFFEYYLFKHHKTKPNPE
jgi:hypothetical protein